MIKPGKNFKLSRASKTMIALMCNTSEDRNQLKGALIQAELSATAARLQSLKSKGSRTKDGE